MLSLFGAHISYAGIVIGLILTGIGLPIPEEVIVILAGVGASQEILNPWLGFAACVIGALIGDLATYGIGHHFGHNVLREHPRYARFLTPEREKQIEKMIQMHGMKVFFLARFLVGLRSPVYLTAGILRVPFRRFILIDTCCATTVIATFYWLSYKFSAQIQGWWQWIRHAEVAFTVAIVVAVVGVILYFYVRHRRRLARINGRRLERTDKLASREDEPVNHSKSVA